MFTIHVIQLAACIFANAFFFFPFSSFFHSILNIRREILILPRFKVTDKFSAVACHCRDSLDYFFTTIYFLNNISAFQRKKKCMAGKCYSRKYSWLVLSAFNAYKNLNTFSGNCFISISYTHTIISIFLSSLWCSPMHVSNISASWRPSNKALVLLCAAPLAPVPPSWSSLTEVLSVP